MPDTIRTYITTKGPDDTLDYIFDYRASTPGPWLESDDEIVESQWFVEPEGELMISAEEHTESTATVWLEGGVLGSTYRVTNVVTTESTPPRVKTMVLLVSVEE